MIRARGSATSILNVPTWTAPLAVGVCALIVVAGIAVSQSRADVIATAIIGVWFLVTGSIGALIVVRRSGHLIGWLLVGIVVLAAAHGFVQNYAVMGLEAEPAAPGALVAGWLSTWLGLPAFGLFVLLILLFPTGGLPSPRWRTVGVAAFVGVAGGALASALMPGPLPAIPGVQNPAGVRALAAPLEVVGNLFTFIPAIALLASVISQIVRLRRATGEERQQIKLVAYAIVMVPVLIVVSQFVITEGESSTQWLEFTLNIVAGMMIPVAIGIAIVRYRLYDIDRIINRTLVYGAVTAVLAGAYVGIVFALQATLSPFTRESDLAIAASTLVVAALFRPVRTRLQSFIDRRFYRRKFDAQVTLDEFSTHLRDEVDLDSLSSKLVSVVTETMQPAHVSLWLRNEVGVIS